MTILSTGLDRDKENVSGYRYLAQAHGMLGEIPQADLATAEGYFYGGVLQGCEDLRGARPADDEARLAGLGQGAGHHQLQAWQEKK